MNFQRDGHMQMTVPKGRANYEPNSLSEAGEDGGPRECPMTGFTQFPATDGPDEQGDKLRIRPESFADHYSQARLFFRSLAAPEQAHLASALVFELSKVGLEHVRVRMMSNLVNCRCGPGQARRGRAWHAPAQGIQGSGGAAGSRSLAGPARSSRARVRRTASRAARSAILVADGSDAKAVSALIGAITGAGARAVIVAPKVGGATLSDGKLLKADAQLAGYPSVLADAVAVILSDDGCAALLKEAAAVQFVMDAFGHLKAIAHSPEAQPLLDKAGVVPDEGVVPPDQGFTDARGEALLGSEPGYDAGVIPQGNHKISGSFCMLNEKG